MQNCLSQTNVPSFCPLCHAPFVIIAKNGGISITVTAPVGEGGRGGRDKNGSSFHKFKSTGCLLQLDNSPVKDITLG
jgi:hypothetical protein